MNRKSGRGSLPIKLTFARLVLRFAPRPTVRIKARLDQQNEEEGRFGGDPMSALFIS